MQTNDEQLWQLAQQRVKFKHHIFSYICVNIFLWLIWFLTDHKTDNSLLPWPAWCSIGWGFALVLRYVKLYHFSAADDVQKEYDKLKNKQG